MNFILIYSQICLAVPERLEMDYLQAEEVPEPMEIKEDEEDEFAGMD